MSVAAGSNITPLKEAEDPASKIFLNQVVPVMNFDKQIKAKKEMESSDQQNDAVLPTECPFKVAAD